MNRTLRSSAHTTSLPSAAQPLVVSDGIPADELLSGFVTRQSEPSFSTLTGDADEDRGQKQPATNGEPRRHNNEEDEEESREREEMRTRPFYRRPSPWWMLGTTLLAAIAMSTTIAPRVELFTALVCRAMKPEYTVEGPVTPVRSQRFGIGGYISVPPPVRMCGMDPDVQAAVARLLTVMTVFPGILSCLTTAWWGQLSDRYGRMWILGIAIVGFLATDFNIILVSRAADHLPGGYLFLLVGPAIGGLFGGMTTLMAGIHAYISDCAPAQERSRFFSLSSGLLFCGMALGPTLGSLLIQATNDLLSVFYFATASHLIYGFFIWLSIIPESLPKSSMRKARKRRVNQQSEHRAASLGSIEQGKFSIWNGMMRFVRTLFMFLAPLSIFFPSKLQGQGRDWSLLLTVFSLAFYGLLMGSYQFKFQYAQRAFGWNAEALGYWLSVVSVARAAYLVLMLPLIIKIFKPKATPIQLPVSPAEPLHSTQSPSERSDGSPHSLRRKAVSFDLNLARVSLGIELMCYTGMVLSKSAMAWIVPSILIALGGGFTPAVQSVALVLYEQRSHEGIETGRLFGALGVVQSLSTQIIGPTLFGFTYVSTANSFPKGIFAVGTGMMACALFFLSLVRLARAPPNRGHEQEETAVDQENE